MEEIKTTQQAMVAVPRASRKDFLETMASTLNESNMPEEAIQCLNPDNVRLVYVKGNLFKGMAEGSWSAKVQGNHNINVNGKKADIKDGTVFSGQIPGIPFCLSIINENQATPYWAKFFVKFAFKGEQFMPYSYVASSGGTLEGEDSENAYSTWMKYSNQIVEDFLLYHAEELSQDAGVAYVALNIVSPEVVKQFNTLFKGKFSSKEVKLTSSRNSVTEDPKPVLIPFYVLDFQFEGNPYFIAMMADVDGAITGQLPPINKNPKTPEQILEEEMPDKVKKTKIIKWCWLLAIVLFLLTSFKIALVYLIAWAIVYTIYDRPVKRRFHELLLKDVDRSSRIKEKLKKQLLK